MDFLRVQVPSYLIGILSSRAACRLNVDQRGLGTVSIGLAANGSRGLSSHMPHRKLFFLEITFDREGRETFPGILLSNLIRHLAGG